MTVCIGVNDVAVTITTDFTPGPSSSSQENYMARLALFDKLFEEAKLLIWRKIFGSGGTDECAKVGKESLALHPATEQDIDAGKASWCSACATECPIRGSDVLVICDHFKENEKGGAE